MSTVDISSLKINGEDDNLKIETCNEMIAVAKSQGRVFLRQKLQARLVRLLNDLQRYTAAIQLSNELISELKKVDDKYLVIQVYLENSKAYYALSSLSKAKTALVAARTTANAIYVSSKLQAALDMHSGIIESGEDFKTAFSYFFEAFENFDSVNEKNGALRCLKLMLLCQVLLGNYDEVKSLMMYKTALKYNSPQLDAMVAIAAAAKNRSMSQFNAAFDKYREELENDPIARKHVKTLSSTMLEKDLCRVVEPYTEVQTSHIAKAVGMDSNRVERKLAQMILDKKLSGCLNQGDSLLVFEHPGPDRTYETCVQTLHAMNEVLDALYARARLLR